MSTHIIGFDEDMTNIIFQLSSNTHLISSSDFRAFTAKCFGIRIFRYNFIVLVHKTGQDFFLSWQDI